MGRLFKFLFGSVRGLVIEILMIAVLFMLISGGEGAEAVAGFDPLKILAQIPIIFWMALVTFILIMGIRYYRFKQDY